MNKRNKGITLIALVITIVILIILAGVSINLVLGQDGIIARAEKAEEETRGASVEEQVGLWKTEIEMTKYAGGTAESYEQIRDRLHGEKLLTDKDIQELAKPENTNLEIKIGSKTISFKVDSIGGDTGEDSIFNTNGNTEIGVAKVNKPELKGMTPVRWEGTTEDNTVTKDSSNWYAYIAGDNSTDSKKSNWANAKTKDGSYFVWIPRYAYKITEKPTTTGNVSGKIEVVFLKGTTNEYDSDGKGTMKEAVADGYIVHPAFTFGTKPLTGIWVGKYEMSSVEGNGNSSADNVTTKTIQIKPNVSSWRYITVSTIFENCYTMASKPIYGFSDVANGDTHMIKNSEWGAIAYLTHSQYGRNRNEISINNSSSFITGKGGVNASTTGNSYGIYDMSGGAYEYVSGNLTEYKGNAGSQTNFDSIYSDSDLRNKFFDFYDYSGTSGSSGREPNYQANSTKKGDAIYETSTAGIGTTSWFSKNSYFIDSDRPWFGRGGYYGCGSAAGVFYFSSDTGSNYIYYSSRVVLAP